MRGLEDRGPGPALVEHVVQPRTRLREGDHTYGQFEHARLGADDGDAIHPERERAHGETHRQTMELLMGDGHATCLKIPPGVAHGCRALERSHVLYVTSSVYDPQDEGRIPHDDPAIGYDWTAGPPIK